ncbi:MAG: anaerobic glycerol-3-phosphate dehydrogenase subunit B [Desulfobacteraceae bacterium]|nr:MAG: anaerobic glycerol-3-phosphate dehydrogenase subunit B [Desulfobacteraceae bacterium]
MNLSGRGVCRCDLAVVGTGMAGMSSALFALNRGLSVAQVGTYGESIFASGLIDLLGVHPIGDRKEWENPWDGISTLVRDIPKHPYAHLCKEDMRAAFEELVSFLQGAGVDYRIAGDRNVKVLTPLGTSKSTYGIPETMWAGVKALERKDPCLLVDFEGYTEFSARQIAESLSKRWKGLETLRLRFPESGTGGELSPLQMAQALEKPSRCDALAQAIRAAAGPARSVGLPAILGIYNSRRIHSDLEKAIGIPVFEILTLPPSAPGMRLLEAFSAGLGRRSVKGFYQSRVVSARQESGGGFLLDLQNPHSNSRIRCRGVVLATGRFLGKGLAADRRRIRETVFDLPVVQPGSREGWHREDFFDPGGHPVNRAGLETDGFFRPVDDSGTPVYERLFAAGSILAHQDWMRMKCGSGLAVTSAYGAVKGFIEVAGLKKRKNVQCRMSNVQFPRGRKK